MLTIQRLVDGTYEVDLHHEESGIKINTHGVYQRIGDTSDAEPDPNGIVFHIKTSLNEIDK